MPQQEKHHHFFRYKGCSPHSWFRMVFVCETCGDVQHIQRGTWDFLVKGRK